jgi:tetratricopeptide (TPR) repeat protein
MSIRLKPAPILLLLVAFALPALAITPQGFEETIVAERHYKLGKKHYQAGKTEQAIDELYTALSVREIYYDAQLLLGRSLVETRRYREAAATLREIEAGRGSTEVHKLMARANYEMNRLSEATRNLYYAIGSSKRPDYELHYLMGLVKLRQGEPEFAINQATRALKLKPRFAPARKLLSDAYLMKGDYRQSGIALTRYLSSVRDRHQAAEIKETIDALKSLDVAKPEKSVQKEITLPRIIRIPRPALTIAALRYNVDGEISVMALFGKDATVQHVLIIHGLGFGLDEEAEKAARKIVFKPGEVDGQPTSMWIKVRLRFSNTEIELESVETHKTVVTELD